MGFGVWFALLFGLGAVAGLVAFARGVPVPSPASADAWVALLLPASIVGWYLFVYGRGTAARRWRRFAIAVAVPAAMTLIVIVSDMLR